MSIQNNLNQLDLDKEHFKNNLTIARQDVLESDTFTELANKLNTLKDYYTNTTVKESDSPEYWLKNNFYKGAPSILDLRDVNIYESNRSLPLFCNSPYLKNPKVYLPSNVTTLNSCFINALDEELDLEGIKDLAIVNFGSTFSGMPNLKTLTLPKLKEGTVVTNVTSMCRNCISLEYLDMSSLDLSDTANIEYIFYGCSNLKTVVVRTTAIKNRLSEMYPNINYELGDLVGISLVVPKNVNLFYTNTFEVSVEYDRGTDDKHTANLTVKGPATINGNTVTLDSSAKEGDVIEITAISNYNSELTDTKTVMVINKEITKSITLDLNDGQFVETEELVNENKVYQSDAGSYHINNGKSIANMVIIGYSKFVVYIKSDAELVSDYTEIFDLGVTPSRGKGILSTKGQQGQWLKKEFNITDKTVIQSISVMYSKDGSVNRGADRGYFYISESECE